MSKEFTAVKIWVQTRRLLRKIATETDETLVHVMERLALAEWAKLKAKTQGDF